MPRPLKPTLLEMVDLLPPKVCRLIARRLDHTRTPYTLTELAQRSGLSVKRIRWILRRDSFAAVPIGEVDAFRSACGITPRNQWKHECYLRRTYSEPKRPLGHLGAGRELEAQGVKLSIGVKS